MHPPKQAIGFLRWFCRPDYLEELEGDLTELFIKDHVHSVLQARIKFSWRVLTYFRPGFIRSFNTSTHTNGMYFNYFKIAWRNLLKKKGYSTVNILGLALGIACCMLVFMYVDYEKSFDTYHTKSDRIFRVAHGWDTSPLDTYWVWGNAPIGPTMKDYFPEIDKVVQFSGSSDILLTHGETAYQEEGVFFIDSTVFDVFSWKLVQGDPKTALSKPFSIVLTESTARKYFGEEDPVGKSLTGGASPGHAEAGEYLVTGVMEDVPANSHFRFNALLSLATFRKSYPGIFTNWGYVDFYTYFMVNEKFDRPSFESKIPAFVNKLHNNNPEDKSQIAIENLGDIYLGSHAQRQPGETGSLANLYIFSVIGLFVLVIAIINFMNLSTARSMERSKEVGIRKSIGAERKQLVVQFLGESSLIVTMSMILAIGIVALALPGMRILTGRELELTPYITPLNAGWLLVATIGVALISGSYPSFVLSSFNPVTVLKRMTRSDSLGILLRKGLVIFQFTLSIVLIAGTLVVTFQMNHILDKKLGFDQEQMLLLDYNYDEIVNDKREVLRAELEALPGITSTAFSRSVPGSYFPNAYTEIVSPEGELKGTAQPVFQVGIDFITHYKLEIVAGRSYSRDFPADTIGGLVLNEAAARQYGYSNPADIIGKKYKQWGREGEVIGVVKDFNYLSLHRNIEPLTLPFEPYACRYISVKVKPDDIPGTIEAVQEIWTRLAPHRPFLYSFLDDDFNRQYTSDLNFRTLFSTFSFLAIFIACLGLLGLATYTAELRTKEIGIRKVLGASVNSVVTLLCRDFILLIGIAIVIATPVAWWSMSQWLENFAYRMNMQVWIFALAGFIAMVIAAVTIGFQAMKAARSNPVDSLRSE